MSEPRKLSEIFLDGFLKNDPFITEHFAIIAVQVPEPPKTITNDQRAESVRLEAEADQVLSIGIPYAQQGIAFGRLYQQCPECGVRVFEDTDEHGERETNNYGEHYEKEHG